MKLEQISKWVSYPEVDNSLQNKLIKSWLLEDGPITKRIKSREVFELNLLKDEIDNVEDLEANFLGNFKGKIKVREVILMGNNIPKVFARSLIPLDTIENGFSKLGALGTKPLGDILFLKKKSLKKLRLFLQNLQIIKKYSGVENQSTLLKIILFQSWKSF